MDIRLRKRAQILKSKVTKLTALFSLSTFGALWYHNQHYTSCNFGHNLTKSAFLQFIALLTKCLLDLDYLSAYGCIQIKIV